MDGSERWYSIKEVAARYGVGRDTVVRRIKSGHLAALTIPMKSSRRTRVYNVRRIHESELQRFERENTR
jgi:excisionase family DNA binding protein